jgi:hypothetical protein
MVDKTTPNKPVYKVAAHGVTVSVWKQKSKEGQEFFTAQLQRSYQDDQKVWKNTETLRMSDIPVAAVLLTEAYREHAIRKL